MKRIGFLIFILFLLIVTSFGSYFKDVPSNHWAYKAVVALSKLGILTGYPDKTFRGNNTVTRYQLASALYNLIVYMQEYVSEKIKKSYSYELAKDVSKLSDMAVKAYKWSTENSEEISKIKSEIEQLKLKFKNTGDAEKYQYSGDLLEEIASLRRSFEDKLIAFDSKYSKKISVIDAKISQIEKDLSNMEDVISTLKIPSNNMSGSKDIENLKKQIEDLERQCKKDIQSLNLDLYSVKKNIAILGERVQKNLETTNDLSEKVKHNSENIDKISQNLKNLSKELESLNESFENRFSILQSDVKDINDKIADISKEIKSNRNKTEELDKRVSELESKKFVSSSMVMLSYLFSLILFGVSLYFALSK